MGLGLYRYEGDNQPQEIDNDQQQGEDDADKDDNDEDDDVIDGLGDIVHDEEKADILTDMHEANIKKPNDSYDEIMLEIHEEIDDQQSQRRVQIISNEIIK